MPLPDALNFRSPDGCFGNDADESSDSTDATVADAHLLREALLPVAVPGLR